MKDVFVTKVYDSKIYVGIHIKRDCQQQLVYLNQSVYVQNVFKDYGF
jgi:hypothetical protein